MRALPIAFGTALAALAAWSCTGRIVDDDQRAPQLTPGSAVPGAGPDATHDPDSPFADGEQVVVDSASVRPLRRLGRDEYRNTLRDLLELDFELDESLPPDTIAESGFLTGTNVSTVEARAFFDYAERLATQAAPQLQAKLSCAANADQACAREFIEQFGARAFRRPLTKVEIERLLALYERARTEVRHDFSGALIVLIQAMIQAPQLLYHWEVGDDARTVENELVQLTPYELASRLSYTLTQSMPDAELMSAAAQSKLGTPAEIEAHARRLLAAPRARQAVGAFFEQWLGLSRLQLTSKDQGRYPEFDRELASEMQREAREFAAAVLLDGDGRWATVLSAEWSVVGGRLASLYGVQAGSTTPSVVQLPSGERSGVLTQLGVLTANANAQEGSPIKRGLLVRERFLCQHLPAPPQEVPPLSPARSGLPTREHFKEHSTNPSCAACHTLMDPVGFGFLHFDAIGRYQTQDGGQPVDATGFIEDIDDTRKPFDGVRQLANILTTSTEARQCMTRQLFRYAAAQKEQRTDGGSLNRALDRFAATEGALLDVLVELVASKAFRYRSPAEGETLL